MHLAIQKRHLLQRGILSTYFFVFKEAESGDNWKPIETMIASKHMYCTKRAVSATHRSNTLEYMARTASSIAWMKCPLSVLRLCEHQIFTHTRKDLHKYQQLVVRTCNRLRVLEGCPTTVPGDPGKGLLWHIIHAESCHWLIPWTTSTTAERNKESVIEQFHAEAKQEVDGVMRRTQRYQATTYCPACHKKDGMWLGSAQTRSADEGQTSYYYCKSCKHEWTVG